MRIPPRWSRALWYDLRDYFRHLLLKWLLPWSFRSFAYPRFYSSVQELLG